MNRPFSGNRIISVLVVMAFIVILCGACLELYNVSWGTGTILGEFSIKWFAIFLVFTLSCLFISVWLIVSIYRDDLHIPYEDEFIRYRAKLGAVNWLFALIVLLLPIWFLQYTMWGLVFKGFYIRALIWIIVVLALTGILTKDDKTFIGWKELLAALLMTSSAFTITVTLRGVTAYPFSLGWSEGNRLWDYSTLFGRGVYDYPADQDIYVLLDAGRLLIGGLPFIFSGITIEIARLWVGLTLILPYFLVGLAAYRISGGEYRKWFMIILWVFLFLKQGPIHPPLVVAAALTILLWDKSLWLSIPLIIYAGFYAQSSRFTWLFAPGIWIGMLELGGGSLSYGKLGSRPWTRAITLSLAGAFGGFLLPKILVVLNSNQAAGTVTDVTEQITNAGVSAEFVSSAVTDQPLLWYRLLPNSTYGTGILLGLLIAVVPTLILLLWLAFTRKWKLNIWQSLALTGPLLAFLAVGLIASTKIGGGGDLHNMDMFLIGMAFTAFIAWMNGGKEALLEGAALPTWLKVVFAISLIIPALGPLRQMRPIQLDENRNTLMVLTDAPDEKSLGLLPTDAVVDRSLEKIQDSVAVAKENGDVLFLDQRQLLTFGYVTDVPLVAEYEKKVLMNEALSSNIEYFLPFYKDLINQRFSLIVSERLFTPLKDSSFEFGEENNAWVKWVANPILCYYEEDRTMKEVGVQLLIPRTIPLDCFDKLPAEVWESLK